MIRASNADGTEILTVGPNAAVLPSIQATIRGRMALAGVRPDDVAGVPLACRRPGWTALVHRSTNEPGRWQLTTFDEQGPWGHTCRDTLLMALDVARADGWRETAYHMADGSVVEVP